MATKAGFSIDELFGKSKRKRPPVAPKYRNPEKPSETWSGRGRQPLWIKEQLEAGKSIDDFLI